VKLSKARIERLCRQRCLTPSKLLREAAVSRNAFYSLLRRREILPRSVIAVAAALKVPPTAILEDTPDAARDMRHILAECDAIVRRHPEADRDVVRHTLILLRKKPEARLRRALLRAQKPDIR
jgi:hypothetical protein